MVIALVFTFNTAVSAVYVSFYADMNTNEKVGYMTGVSLRNGTMDLDIIDFNTSDGYNPNDMQRDGYIFKEWKEFGDHNSNTLTIDNENKTIAFDANNDSNPRNVGATWTTIDYKIDLDLGEGGTSQNPETYTIEDQDIIITAPERTGYIFEGWTDDTGADLGTTFTIPAGSMGDISLIALWTAIDYTITYDLDEGIVEGNPETYTADDEFTLNNPTREGYTFTGWEKAGELIGITCKIEKGTTGNLEFKATWIKNEYTIQLKFKGKNLNLDF